VLVADGVFVHGEPGSKPVFRALPAPSPADIRQIAWSTCQKAVAYLRHKGKGIDADVGAADRLSQEEPLLSSCYAGSLAGTLILGENAGKRLVRRFGRAARDAADGGERAAKVRQGYTVRRCRPGAAPSGRYQWTESSAALEFPSGKPSSAALSATWVVDRPRTTGRRLAFFISIPNRPWS
jgi:hypothetical protein